MNRPKITLAESYVAASRIARQSASSFYPSFWLLPRPKRLAMCTFYAFARLTDDVADADLPAEQKLEWLTQWRQCIDNNFQQEPSETTSETAIQTLSSKPASGAEQRPLEELCTDDDLAARAASILPALADMQRRYRIEPTLFLELIDGSITDQRPVAIESFAELEDYCYLVASTVGLVCLHIWQYEGERTREAAIECGKAFQLTNILRDVNEDRQQGRCYLAADDLHRFGVDPASPDAVQLDAWRSMLDDYCKRAASLYESGWDAYDGIHPDGRAMFSMMWHSYHELLTRIHRDPVQVLQQRLRLSWSKKLRIATSHFGPMTVRRLVRSMHRRRNRS